MKTYFGYIRVSTPKQGRGVSLDEQRAAIVAFAERRGLKIDEWYVETETAAKQGRTQYTKMLRALERGKAAGVIIHKIDRSARNMKDWANLGELIDRGIDVQFAHESIDLRSRGGRLAADIQAVVAADYIRNLRDEVLKGFYGRLKQGVYPLPAPVGYLDMGAGVPKAIDPVMGPLVRYAFERYSKGNVSLHQLATEMQALGLKTSRGTVLSRNALAGMLHNKFYVAIIHIKRRGETFEGAHEPLINKELYDRVQAVLSGRHIPKAKRHEFRYRGLIRHEGCTRRLTGERIKGRFVYYRCHGPECHGTIAPESAFDAAIEATLMGLALAPEEMKDFRDIVEAERATAGADAVRDTQKLKMRIDGCEDRLTRLTDAYLDGTITKEAYDARNSQLLAEKRGLQDKLDALNGEPSWYEQCKKFELKNPQILSYGSLSDAEKRDLLHDVCSNLALDRKKPVIELRSPYREIKNAQVESFGGPLRSDVRTTNRIGMVSSYPSYANTTSLCPRMMYEAIRASSHVPDEAIHSLPSP